MLLAAQREAKTGRGLLSAINADAVESKSPGSHATWCWLRAETQATTGARSPNQTLIAVSLPVWPADNLTCDQG